MEHERIHDRERLRALLLESEQSRSDPHQRELFWDEGTRWQRCLEKLAEREHASDTEFQREIDEARRGSETQTQRESQWFAALRSDVAWYEQVLVKLQHTDNSWQNERGVSEQARQELYNHIGQMTWRRLDRQIVFHQLGIEMLERRRQHRGGINEKHWREHWEKLRTGFADQDAAYGTIPASVIEQRLSWAQRVYELQRETEQLWRQQSNVDYRGLRADMATISNFISHVSPQPAGSGGIGIIGAVVVIAIIVGIATAIGHSNSATPSTKVATISGAAQAATVVPTTAQAAAMPAGNQQQLNQIGVDLLTQGKCEEAVQQFRAAVDADPAAYAAYEPLNNMAFCLFDLQRSEEAIAKWQQALAIEPKSPDANAGLAIALYTRGQQDEALQFYRNAVTLQAGYADEAYLRDVVFWSAHAIEVSRPLREAMK